MRLIITKRTICAECEFCDAKGPLSSAYFYKCKCKYRPYKTNYVTGEKVYENDCYKINTEGFCPLFKARKA
jgi:hypothetical protein